MRFILYEDQVHSFYDQLEKNRFEFRIKPYFSLSKDQIITALQKSKIDDKKGGGKFFYLEQDLGLILK